MKIDMHVHTNRYSSCSLINPYDLAHGINNSGVDGIVITEHNVSWPLHEREELRNHVKDKLLLWGVELSGASGTHYLIYYGDDLGKLNFYEDMEDYDIFRIVQEKGAVIVPAHIFRFGRNISILEISRLQIHGLEVRSRNIDVAEMRRSIDVAEKLHLCQIAGSDGHSLDAIGDFYTEFHTDISNEQDLVNAVRNNLCTPVY